MQDDAAASRARPVLRQELSRDVVEGKPVKTVRDYALLDEVTGRIGFPTMVNERRAYFSWQPGEETLRSWRFADEDADRPIPASWLKELSLTKKS